MRAMLSMPRMSAGAMLSALPYVLKRQMQQDVLTTYVTDTLRMVTENTAKLAGGAYMPRRYADIIFGRDTAQPQQSAEEIAADVIARAGIKVVS